MIKRLLCILLMFCILLQGDLTANASSKTTKKKIETLKKEQEQTKEELEDAQKKRDQLQSARKKLEDYLIELNNNLAALSEELAGLEQELVQKQEELDYTGLELQEAKETEDRQYQNMKKRIQFMYENGDIDYLTLFLEAESFGDFLNKADYAGELVEYDRDMLDRFRETKLLIEEKEALLTQEKEQLQDIQARTESKRTEVAQLVESTGVKMAAYTADIQKAQKEVQQIEGKLEEQEDAISALIAKAKEQEEEEERKKQEEAAKNPGTAKPAPGNSNNGAVPGVGGSDMDMLAAIIHCEASGEGYEGQLAVGAVIMNRVRSAAFPNNIMSVIYQGGQFSPVSSGRFIIALSQNLASATCRQAAADAVSGASNIGNCLYFRRNNGTIPGIVIGNHVFY